MYDFQINIEVQLKYITNEVKITSSSLTYFDEQMVLLKFIASVPNDRPLRSTLKKCNIYKSSTHHIAFIFNPGWTWTITLRWNKSLLTTATNKVS